MLRNVIRTTATYCSDARRTDYRLGSDTAYRRLAASSLLGVSKWQEGNVELAKLVTMSFDKNVGSVDRVFRVLSGVALAVAGWGLDLALWLSVTMTALGLMWTAGGLLSRCSIYYMLGYSTCPIRNERLNAHRL